MLLTLQLLCQQFSRFLQHSTGMLAAITSARPLLCDAVKAFSAQAFCCGVALAANSNLVGNFQSPLPQRS